MVISFVFLMSYSRAKGGSLTTEEWKKQIADAASKRPNPIKAVTFLRLLNGSISRAFAVKDAAGGKYAVKGMQDRTGVRPFDIRRPLCNDQIVGRLGQKIGAPVPDTVFIELTKEFIDANPAISFMYPGVCHGQALMDDCSEKLGIQHVDVSENRARFAAIAVLYGWIPSGDGQLIYQKKPPYLVYSVDHGHFFPQGPFWTLDTLKKAPPPAIHPSVISACKLAPSDISSAITSLGALQSADIASAVGMPIDGWGLSVDERSSVAEYLENRRDVLVATKTAAPNP